MRIRQRIAWVSAGRPGFSLIEMLAVMLGLGIVMMLGVATLLGALQVHGAAGAAYQRLALRTEMADQFRADVAEATSAPDSVDNIKATSTCLLLRMADGKLIAYRWETGQLERSVSKDAKTTRARFYIGDEAATVEFTREGAGGRLITLRLGESRGQEKLKRETTLAAALGGDLR